MTTLAEAIKAAHEANQATTDNRVKLPNVRKGDIVAIRDEKGELTLTGTVMRKPSTITIIRVDGTERTSSLNTRKMVLVDAGVWVYDMSDSE